MKINVTAEVREDDGGYGYPRLVQRVTQRGSSNSVFLLLDEAYGIEFGGRGREGVLFTRSPTDVWVDCPPGTRVVLEVE